VGRTHLFHGGESGLIPLGNGLALLHFLMSNIRPIYSDGQNPSWPSFGRTRRSPRPWDGPKATLTIWVPFASSRSRFCSR